MPVYEYRCQACGHAFERWWPSVAAVERAREAGEPIRCPRCGSGRTRRGVSRVSMLREQGGLTPAEERAQRAQEERMASITPKELIDRLQRKRPE